MSSTSSTYTGMRSLSEPEIRSSTFGVCDCSIMTSMEVRAQMLAPNAQSLFQPVKRFAEPTNLPRIWSVLKLMRKRRMNSSFKITVKEGFSHIDMVDVRTCKHS